MKKIRKFSALLLALAMSLTLMNSAMALEPPTRGVRQIAGLTVETVNGPYITPRATHGTYHYHAREERNTYDCTFTFDCSEGVGNSLDVSINNSTGDVPLRIYVYYGGKLVDQYLMYDGETETTYISSEDGSALDQTGKLVVKPANGGDSVYWVTIYQHN